MFVGLVNEKIIYNRWFVGAFLARMEETMIDMDAIAKEAITNRGSFERIKRVMRNAQNGEPIVLGFLGGSITQGSLSSTPQTCYTYQVFQWWKDKFPRAVFEYVNTGIGGTTSQFGVARVEGDLLCYNPDFVIVEFSVNDENNEFFEETYEGLIRKIYQVEKEIGMLIANNVRYDNGVNAQEIHNKIGNYYSLPCVSMKNSLYPFVKAGEIIRSEITPDDLHPNDVGHKLVAQVINRVLDEIYQEMPTVEDSRIMPPPLTKNAYETSVLYQNDNCSPVLNGFQADSSTKENCRDIFKKGWFGSKIGDSISFDIQGTGIAIQYRKTIHKPTPIAKVTIDDKEEAIILNGNFEETWGDCLFIETVLIHGEDKKHKVTIEIMEDHKEDKVPFYLVSVIGS